jgi:hypothetical protein
VVWNHKFVECVSGWDAHGGWAERAPHFKQGVGQDPYVSGCGWVWRNPHVRSVWLGWTEMYVGGYGFVGGTDM